MFNVRLEYCGPNKRNKSGTSEKFWSCRSFSPGFVEVSWGKLGTFGNGRVVKPTAYFEKKYSEKLRKGYEVTQVVGELPIGR